MEKVPNQDTSDQQKNKTPIKKNKTPIKFHYQDCKKEIVKKTWVSSISPV